MSETVCQLPDILFIQLKRFQHNGIASKVSTEIVVPEYLDLRPFCATAVMTHLDLDAGGFIYRLTSTCHHTGESVNSGHYWATCRGMLDGVWRRYDDEVVTEIACPVGLDTTGYLFFYERVGNAV